MSLVLRLPKTLPRLSAAQGEMSPDVPWLPETPTRLSTAHGEMSPRLPKTLPGLSAGCALVVAVPSQGCQQSCA